MDTDSLFSVLVLREKAAAYLREPRGVVSDADLRRIAARPPPPVLTRPGVCGCGVTYRGRAIAPEVAPSLQWLANTHAQSHAALVIDGRDHDEGDAWRLTALLCRAEPSNSQRLEEIVRGPSQK